MTERSALLVTPEALAQEIGVPIGGGAGDARTAADVHSAVQTGPAISAEGATHSKVAASASASATGSSGHAPRTLVLDVRWSLGEPDGHRAFAAGHIPGAVYVDLDRELSTHGPATAGRHPLPGDDVLTQAARKWGLRSGDRVVAYDGGGNLAAARAWWLLRDAGVDVRLLDGAWPAWVATGLPVESSTVESGTAESGSAETGEPGKPERASVGGADTNGAHEITLVGGRMPRLTIDEVASEARAGVVLDARAAERYSGETEPVDPRAGHIPGARSLPTTGHLNDDGTFLSGADLRAHFEAVGVRFDDAPTAAGTTPAGARADATSQANDAQANDAHEDGAQATRTNRQRVGAYCGSGITASHTLFALELAGHSGALYPGSWSQWANHPERPVATGPLP